MELVLIEPNSHEWNYMWEWLASHPINEGIIEPTAALNDGEAWQYMGSYKQDDRVIHSFRHRNHPRINERKDLNVQASDKFTTDQIHRKFKL